MAGMPPPALLGRATGLPPSVPGVTASPMAPGASLMGALSSREDMSSELIKKAIELLQSAAGMDERMSPRIGAALEVLRGPGSGKDKDASKEK